MASMSVSPYRDRTSEFRSLSERLKKIEGISSSSSSIDHHETTKDSDPLLTSQASTTLSSSSALSFAQSDFKKKASRVGLGIHETSQKIARLAQMSKRSSMFDDPLVEIQELTALIKNDITALNMSVSDLQTLQNMEIADENYSKDRAVHATTICDDLKNRLMGTTKQFQNVLTTRTENLKAHETRKQIFSTNSSREKPFLNHAQSVTEPPPWSNTSKTSEILSPSIVASNGVQSSNQLRKYGLTEKGSNNAEMLS